jgi:hypothetical protein
MIYLISSLILILFFLVGFKSNNQNLTQIIRPLVMPFLFFLVMALVNSFLSKLPFSIELINSKLKDINFLLFIFIYLVFNYFTQIKNKA